MKPLNTAILGAGIGASHLEAYLSLPERYRVVILCDSDIDRAQQVVAGRAHITVEKDINVVLSNPEIELIDICLPPHLHYGTAMQALEQGKHVVCEKPLVSSLQHADSLLQQAAKCNRFLAPVFQYRYGLATAQLRALMRAGLTGKPYVASLETHWNRGGDYYAVPWRGTWQGEQGGAVLGHAIHAHDLLTHFFGPVASLFATTTTRVNDIETEDCAAIAFVMENGALASSSITLGAATDTTRLRFCFENVTAQSGSLPYAPAEDHWSFIARGAVSQQQIDDCLASVDDAAASYVGFFAALSDAMHRRRGAEVTPLEGRRSIELVTAIYSSCRSGKKVELPLDSSSDYYSGWNT